METKIPTNYQVKNEYINWNVHIPNLKIAIGYCMTTRHFERNLIEIGDIIVKKNYQVIAEWISDNIYATARYYKCDKLNCDHYVNCSDECDLDLYHDSFYGGRLIRVCVNCESFNKSKYTLVFGCKRVKEFIAPDG